MQIKDKVWHLACVTLRQGETMLVLLQDLRFAVRQLRHSPALAIFIICTLALGIGSATAVFSVVDAMLLHSLPFAHQERLFSPQTVARTGYQQPWSLLSFQDTRRQLKTFAALAGYTDYSKINLESPSNPISLQVVKGTDNFFDVFGVRPLLGRTFLPGEEQPGRDDVAVLSYRVWKTQFGGKRDVIGKAARLDGIPYTIIGVMPANFRFPISAINAIYTPLHVDPRWAAHRGSHFMQAVGALKPGVTRAEARAEITSVLADLGRAYPDTDAGRTVKLVPLAQQQAGSSAAPLKILMMAVLALLAIACVNVAGLLLVRGVKREREVALRAALGAGRGRLVRQALTETLVLGGAGLMSGLFVSTSLLAAMRRFLIDSGGNGIDPHLNGYVLVVAIALTAATTLLASLAPAIRIFGTDPNRTLRVGGSAGTGPSQHSLRSIFVITQVALSLVLLVVSGLLIRDLQATLRTNLGFDPHSILTEAIQLSPGRYQTRDPLVTFYQPLLERVRQLPGVTAVGIIDKLPIQVWGSNSEIHIAGHPATLPNREMLAETRILSPGYYDVMGIKLLDGRLLSASIDTPDHKAGAVVVNDAFRKEFFSSGGEPVGAHIDDSDQEDAKTGIVGVTTSIRQDLRQAPLAEWDWIVDEVAPKDRLDNLANMTLVIRASGDPEQLVPSVRNAIREIDPTVPLRPETMTEVVRDSLVFERLENWLFAIFAGLALLLALVGLYGLTSHEVEMRTRDIGIRMALGSTRADVVRQVLKRVATLMLLGIAAGWTLTLAIQRVLASVVVLHAAHDAALLSAVTLTLTIVGIAAGLLPARRAASVDPVIALRAD
jgi:predicted permease